MKKPKTYMEVRDYRIKVRATAMTKKALERHFRAIKQLVSECESNVEDDWDLGEASVISVRGLID